MARNNLIHKNLILTFKKRLRIAKKIIIVDKNLKNIRKKIRLEVIIWVLGCRVKVQWPQEI